MKNYIMELARVKGIKVDPAELEGKCEPSPSANENCTIYVPDVGIIL